MSRDLECLIYALKYFHFMSTEPTKEKLLKLLKRKGLDNLITELENDPECLEDWKNMTKEDWKEVAGVLAGIQIYNYLHPRREGITFLIIGIRVLPPIQIDTNQMTDLNPGDLLTILRENGSTSRKKLIIKSRNDDGLVY